MNLELTIQSMFDEYPTLFIERADCLDHLFVCIGNGYAWKNGELVSSDDKYKKSDIKKFESHLVNGKAFQHNKMSLRAQSEYYHQLRLSEGKPDMFSDIYTTKELEEMHQKHLASLPDDVYHKAPRRERWYCHRRDSDGTEYLSFSKDYMKLFNYPADVAPDWLEAINETKALLKEDLSDLLLNTDSDLVL